MTYADRIRKNSEVLRRKTDEQLVDVFVGYCPPNCYKKCGEIKDCKKCLMCWLMRQES